MRPVYLVVVSLVFAIASMVIICSQKNRIFVRENSLDDIGLNYRRDKARQADLKDPRIPNPAPAPQPQVKEVNKDSSGGFGYSMIVIVSIILGICTGPIGVVICLCVLVPLLNSFKNKKSKKIADTRTVTNGKAPAHEKFLLCLKPLIGAVISFGVLLFTPNADEYYYISAIICIVAVLLSFWDIIKLHNDLATRKLPQFDKRGGDE